MRNPSSLTNSLWTRARSSSIRSFVGHVSVMTLGNFVRSFSLFVQSVIVARILGPELYGVAALAMAFPDLIFSFFDARSYETIIKYLAEFREYRNKSLAVCSLGYIVDLATASLSFIVVLIGLPFFSTTALHSNDFNTPIIVYTLSYFFQAGVGTPYALMASLKRFSYIAALNMISAVAKTIAIIGLVIAGWGIKGVLIGNAFGNCFRGVAFALSGVLLSHRLWGQVWVWPREHLRDRWQEIFRFIITNDLSCTVNMAFTKLDVIVLGYLCPAVEVGFYKLGRSVANLTYLVTVPLHIVTYTELTSRFADTRHLRIRGLMRRFLVNFSWPIVIVAIIICLFILPPIVLFLFGEDFRPGIPTIQVLCLSSSITVALFWVRPLYLSANFVQWWLAGTLLANATFILCGVLATQFFFSFGMAITSLITTAIFYLTMIIIYWKLFYPTLFREEDA